MVTIQIDGPLEDRLKRAAALSGDEPALLAHRMLERSLPHIEPTPDSSRHWAALESFIEGMGDWVSQHVPQGHFADDSRESIYEGRGE